MSNECLMNVEKFLEEGRSDVVIDIWVGNEVWNFFIKQR